ncbi:MAG: hypothetical protein M3O03_05515 [Pseudomonadota bacterium]|nr:hypothetical protein [Pseudomonadota bacterium]
MIEEQRSLFLKHWAETLRRQRFLPQENTATIDSAALRLLPHLRRLVIVDAKPAEAEMQRGNGHVTLYVLHGTQTLMKRLVAKTDMNVALACGNRRQLKRFMEQRLGVYDAIESSAAIDAKFIDELRKSFVVRTSKRS